MGNAPLLEVLTMKPLLDAQKVHGIVMRYLKHESGGL